MQCSVGTAMLVCFTGGVKIIESVVYWLGLGNTEVNSIADSVVQLTKQHIIESMHAQTSAIKRRKAVR